MRSPKSIVKHINWSLHFVRMSLCVVLLGGLVGPVGAAQTGAQFFRPGLLLPQSEDIIGAFERRAAEASARVYLAGYGFTSDRRLEFLAVTMDEHGKAPDFVELGYFGEPIMKLPPVAGFTYRRTIDIKRVLNPGNATFLLEMRGLWADKQDDDDSLPWPYMNVGGSGQRPPVSPGKILPGDPANRPVVIAAGFIGPPVREQELQELRVLALVFDPDGASDIESVELYASQKPTSLKLEPASAVKGQPGMYWYEGRFNTGAWTMPAGGYIIELAARDWSGNHSFLWPYLSFGESNEPVTPPSPQGVSTPYVVSQDDYDTTPPKIQDAIPPHMSANVERNQEISFTLSDEFYGIEASSINVTIDGRSVQKLAIEGNVNEYRVSFRHNELWDTNTTVCIGVSANDWAGNTMDEHVWAFSCGDTVTLPTSAPVPTVINPSLLSDRFQLATSIVQQSMQP